MKKGRQPSFSLDVFNVINERVLDSALEYETVDGIVLPTHRRALGRDLKQEEPDRAVIQSVEVTITDFHILNQRHRSVSGGS